MAEISNINSHFHRQILSSTAITSRSVNAFEDGEGEEEAFRNVYAFDFDSLSPTDSSSFTPSNNGNLSFTTVSQPDPGTQEFESGNFFFYDHEEVEYDSDDEQMNFVTDLFGTHRGLPDEPDFIQFACSCMDEEPEVVLGLGSECSRVTTGLRIVDMDSDSDSEAIEVNSGVIHDQDDELEQPGFWDCLHFDGQRTEEFEWEEVNIRENLSLLIDRIEQLSISSVSESSPFIIGGEAEEEDNARNVEWQVLLAVNNLEFESEYDEYNVQFGELVEGDSSTIRGNPPAAKSVVETLPSVVLTMEDLVESNAACAVCKDEISVGVMVIKLPCCHHYHKDCIFPWLAIRNTCPLCRHELPTDDVDYEKRKNENGAVTGLVDDHDDFLVRYNYQVLP